MKGFIYHKDEFFLFSFYIKKNLKKFLSIVYNPEVNVIDLLGMEIMVEVGGKLYNFWDLPDMDKDCLINVFNVENHKKIIDKNHPEFNKIVNNDSIILNSKLRSKAKNDNGLDFIKDFNLFLNNCNNDDCGVVVVHLELENFLSDGELDKEKDYIDYDYWTYRQDWITIYNKE